jgi:hypothetical protein
VTLYRKLEVVASDTEHNGMVTVGAMLDGAFVTLGAFKTGMLSQLQTNPTALAVDEADNTKKSASKDEG